MPVDAITVIQLSPLLPDFYLLLIYVCARAEGVCRSLLSLFFGYTFFSVVRRTGGGNFFPPIFVEEKFGPWTNLGTPIGLALSRYPV